MTQSEVEVTVREVLATVLERPIAQGRSTANGPWDSLDWINILFGLEEAFGIEFSESDGLDGLLSLDGLVAAVERRLGAWDRADQP